MSHVVAGFSGGYHYGKAREGKAEKEIPEKDGLFDHIFDSAQYAVDHIKPISFALLADPDAGALDIVDPGVGTDGYNAD
jgi:hypothetical protein